MGHATDSAIFQLTAACTLMTPNQAMFDRNILYLTLGVGESNYAAPYLGFLPAIAYLDYDHEMRLFLKSLKYSTLNLMMWPGEYPVLVNIEHLQELQTICLSNEVPFSENDLLFARYLHQNCDAALRVLDDDVADLLDKHVVGSNGTSLYIKAVSSLMSPFLKPSSDPNEMQKKASRGITIFRLWKKVIELKKMRMTSGKNASANQNMKGNFITSGCYKTAEILFTAATNHMLAMFAHFKELGPQNCSPYKSGTKTTERIISEFQGKTTKIQTLDAQPTTGDILNRVSAVQFSQLAEDRLIEAGAKKQSSTNRKRLSHSKKNVNIADYCYPVSYESFLDQQRHAYNEGVMEGKNMFEKYCGEAASFLKSKNQWNFVENTESTIPEENRFCGALPRDYGVEKLNNIKSHKYLTNICKDLEDELREDCILTEDIFEQEEEPLDDPDDSGDEVKMQKRDQKTKKEDLNKEWYVSKIINDKLTLIHVKRAIKIILPREYVSRERSRRHIAANYLPGLSPIDKNHDVHKYSFYLFKLSTGYHLGKICFLEENGNSLTSCSSNRDDAKFRAILLFELDDNKFEFFQPMKLTGWLNIARVYSEVHLKKADDSVFLLNENSQRIF